MKLNIYRTATDTATALLRFIIKKLTDSPNKVFDIAFSGGTTPSLMFDLWAHDFAEITPWQRIRFWWVDERCVNPDDPDSNYGEMKRLLLDVVPISEKQVFRIHGESNPAEEAVRYSKLAESHLSTKDGLPVFDLVLLGVGEDGHTSSIFPGQESLLTTSCIYESSIHPHTHQKRVALTGLPIINALQVVFLITGKEKAKVVKELYSFDSVTPSAYIAHRAQQVELFLDEAAGSLVTI